MFPSFGHLPEKDNFGSNSNNMDAITDHSNMSRDMRFPTMWHFDKCILRRACAASFLSLETPNNVRPVA